MKAIYISMLASLIAFVGLGQSYRVDWHTIDGGGGTSSGDGYTIIGTIGQPDASTTAMTGGQYAMEGGFWAIEAVQTPGGPHLSIAVSGPGQVTIWWTPDTPGWILQESPDLSTAAWTNSPSGANNPVIVPATLPKKFYRLFKP